MTGVFVPSPGGVLKSLFGKGLLNFLLLRTVPDQVFQRLYTGPYCRNFLYIGYLWEDHFYHELAYGI